MSISFRRNESRGSNGPSKGVWVGTLAGLRNGLNSP